MKFLIGLLLAGLIALAFREPLKRYPAFFYGIALLADILFIISRQFHVPPWLKEYVLFLFQSNSLAMGLFIVVMFIGVFKEGSGVKKALLSVRAELSILASILCSGHIVIYGQTYLTQLFSTTIAMPIARVSATLIALALVLLLVPLAITSIKALHSRISPHTWMRVQKLAYPFFGLIFIHISLYLIPSAIGGSLSAAISAAAYLLTGSIYLVLRLRLHLWTRQKFGAKSRGLANVPTRE
jgi:DMSO/TMAO reductase YedYZ heme-binding membrane subunit